MPQVSEMDASPSSPAAPTSAPEVSVPKAPVHADVIPDIVTHADLPQSDAPSPVSNASFGEDGTLAGPVVVEGQRGTGVGGPERGERGSWRIWERKPLGCPRDRRIGCRTCNT